MFDDSPIRPPRLRPGDTIAVVAPSSPQRDDERLRAGIRTLESLGYRVVEGKSLWNRYGYLAGSDDERTEDFNRMLRDPEVRMIVAGRGGYGATRILERIDFSALRDDPKIVLGFSDVTAINLAALAHAEIVTFSGAMPGVDLWEEEPDAFMLESLLNAVRDPAPAGVLTSPFAVEAGEEMVADDWESDESAIAGELPKEVLHGERMIGLRDGMAEGRLIPANLTLLASLCGSDYLPDLAGAILLIEEIGEEAYRIDRLLSQLWNAGLLQRLAGLAFGAFTGTKATRVSIAPLPVGEVFAEYVRRAGVPAVAGVPYGHIRRKLTLPVGALARIDGNAGSLELLEGGVV